MGVEENLLRKHSWNLPPSPSLLKAGGRIFQKLIHLGGGGVPKIWLKRRDNPEKGEGVIEKWGDFPFYYFTFSIAFTVCIG